MNKHPHSGFTLLELMATISIVAILAAIAVPSFTSTLEKRRIVGAAEQLQSDLRWARAEAIKRNKTVRVSFTKESPWSYTINVDPGGANLKIKQVKSEDYSGTTLASAAFAGNVVYSTFDPIQGINRNNGTATFSLGELSLSVVISRLGRVHICGNTGGYEKCRSN